MTGILIVFGVMEALLLLISLVVFIWASRTDKGLLAVMPVGWVICGTVALAIFCLIAIFLHDHVHLAFH